MSLKRKGKSEGGDCGTRENKEDRFRSRKRRKMRHSRRRENYKI
jgi:hypothetical protein